MFLTMTAYYWLIVLILAIIFSLIELAKSKNSEDVAGAFFTIVGLAALVYMALFFTAMVWLGIANLLYPV